MDKVLDTKPALANQSQEDMENDWDTSPALTDQSQEDMEEGPAHHSQHLFVILVVPTPRQSLGSPWRGTGSILVRVMDL